MSDVGGGPDVPATAPPPAGGGFWARVVALPIWAKIAIPVVVVALVVGIVALINSNDSSTSTSDEDTEKVLALMAAKMAATEAAASTTVAETTTTDAETTTTEEETTTEAETTVPETTTTVPETTTTVAPTTIPAPPPTTPPTIPETTTTEAETTTTEAETTTTEEETTTTEAETTTTEEETTTTEEETTTTEAEPPTSEPAVPPGALFASLEDFQAAWNAAAKDSSVAQISEWTPIDVNGTAAQMATLGGNLRVGAVLRAANGAVTQVALGWLPLADESQQAAQNAAFNDAFAILVRTVNPGASAAQQSNLASDLGISSTQPPFPTGTTKAAPLEEERYVLEAVDVPGQDGPVTIVGARLDLGRG